MESEILLYLLAMLLGSIQYEPVFVATLVLVALLVLFAASVLFGRLSKKQ